MKERIVLTSDDLPSLDRLQQFFANRDINGGFSSKMACNIIAAFLARLAKGVRTNGSFASDQRVDRNGMSTR